VLEDAQPQGERKPGGVAANAPASFIDVDDGGVAQGEEQLRVERQMGFGHALVCPGQGSAGDGQAKGALKKAGDFGIGDAQVMLGFGGQGQGARAEHDVRCAEGIRVLEGVMSLEMPATSPALPDMDMELGRHRFDGGQIDLVLRCHTRFGHLPPAAGAGGRQGGVVAGVNLGWDREGAKGAQVADFAAGAFGVGLGRPFGKGRGLTLPSPLRFFELPLQASHFVLRLVQLALELHILGRQVRPGVEQFKPRLVASCNVDWHSAAIRCKILATR
jgi:hypothetical protein